MPSKIKTDPETPIYFLSPADSGLVPSGNLINFFMPSNLPAGSGQCSNLYNLGSPPRTTLFEWRSIAPLTIGSGNVGQTIEQYIACSNDGQTIDGSLPVTGTGLQNPDQRRNLGYIGPLTLDGNPTLITSGFVQIFSQYVSVMWWNSTTNALAPSGNMVILTPVPDELQ